MKEHDHMSIGSQLKEQEMLGQIIGKKIGLFDDMALSLSTLKEASRTLIERIEYGKKNNLRPQDDKVEIYAATAHFDPTPVTYSNLKEMFEKGWLTAFTTTSSNPIPPEFLGLPGFRCLDVSERVAKLAKILAQEESTSPLFDDI